MQNRDKVIYDERIPKIKEQQKRRSNRRFVFFSILFFILLTGILYTQSPFSKLAEIEWKGNELLQPGHLMEQADLRLGMSYFNFTGSQVKTKLEELAAIEGVEVTRHFPNRLEINVKEYPHVAFWMQDQELYPVLSTGHILLEEPWQGRRVDKPILSGWPHQEGLIELSTELEQLPRAVSSQISEITLTPIVSDPYRLTLYMTDGYEVRTSIRRFAENMHWYPQIVEQAQAEGKEEGIFYLLYGKWLEDPVEEEETVPEENDVQEEESTAAETDE